MRQSLDDPNDLVGQLGDANVSVARGNHGDLVAVGQGRADFRGYPRQRLQHHVQHRGTLVVEEEVEEKMKASG